MSRRVSWTALAARPAPARRASSSVRSSAASRPLVHTRAAASTIWRARSPVEPTASVASLRTARRLATGRFTKSTYWRGGEKGGGGGERAARGGGEGGG